MSDRDLDSLYKSASGQDGARPSAAVRQAILEHARRLADKAGQQAAGAVEDPLDSRERARKRGAEPSRWSRWASRWSQLRWQVAVPLAAAAIAVIVLQPQLRSTLPASAKLQQSVAPPTEATRPTPVPPASDTVINSPVPPPPLTARARPVPVPFPAAPKLMPSESSGAPAAPPATPPSESARAEPAPAEPAPTAANALAANLASSADTASSQSATSGARMQARPSAAPLAERREQTQMPSEAAAAHVLSPSELLHQAAEQGDEQRVRSLLQQNAMMIDARDASGRTALMLAVLQGHEAVVRALLEQGADPNIGDAAGIMPIAVARQQHQPRMVDALLQAGAH
jgi:hypothetical protein